MTQKSTARPSKAILSQITKQGRTCINVTLGGQARYWRAYRLPEHMHLPSERAWEVELRDPMTDETLVRYDLYQDIVSGRITCLDEGWQDRMYGSSS